MSSVDPNKYIISRKRKKYKFALFYNSPICFEFEDWQVPDARHSIVELAAGTGYFATELAVRHSDKQVIAIDVKGDRLQRGAKKAEERKLNNIAFLRARADQVGECLRENSVEQLWITFTDPHPKKRSARRRLTHDHFLDYYKKLISTSGALCIKHDDIDFFHWTLERLIVNGWRITEISFDLHGSDLDDNYKIITTYEQRWINEGKKIFFVRAEPV